jgi:hypothetical protein
MAWQLFSSADWGLWGSWEGIVEMRRGVAIATSSYYSDSCAAMLLGLILSVKSQRRDSGG